MSKSGSNAQNDSSRPPIVLENEPIETDADFAQPDREPRQLDGELAESEAALRSIHTSSVPEILAQLSSSLLVTTYQTGKLVILRNEAGVLNTHFRWFNKPMGMAIQGGRLAVGCANRIQEFHNVPAVATRLEPAGKHDAAWLPRRENVTGDIQIHEMAWIPSETSPLPELWFVNTAFSCLCVRSNEYSFEPRWRPRFLSQYSPDDRCHLNGLTAVNGRVKYVTALGNSNEAFGWRKNKRDGGILIDIDSNEIIARGLSMPHSPRWYDGRLWVLNSGTGGFGMIDVKSGHYEEVAQLPGFTRGLCFRGPFAFVGLSQVRESAVFGGIPLVERLQSSGERSCGVWVVNIQTGQTVGFVKFEDAVQEIFAVELLAGQRFPELIQDDSNILAAAYVLPDEALADVPAAFRIRDGLSD
ncbi:TIGR03032 family protein [Novipirellula artificiosorum]|uniref:Conserved hypothetical protein CHP03032 domain-containing protein n=1 Tax=Novipirellula artificiosorum TaxID=2528016 RepID=A0A5C6D9P7_9BACT|nr:TIGR03032 family protein [Novipirellula artificiosorum]TWU31956.1 hypothetical protein Poly41_58440 [Novipirellula artificiosorum]